MDRVLSLLASFTTSLRFDDLPLETVHQAKRLWIDTLGCAIGAADAPPVKVARSLAHGGTGDRSVPVLGGGRATVEWATFVNGVQIRYLDYNDFYQAPHVKTGGHPTDTFAPGLAICSLPGHDGRALILAGVLGWEVYAKLGDAIATRVLDQGTHSSVAAACVASNLRRSSADQTASAIAIAAVSNLSVRQTRYGNVSMWKACAVPFACKNGVEAALLAGAGLTGPDEAFEGRSGVFKITTGSFDLFRPFGGPGVPFQIHDSSIKVFPIGSVAQTAIECALRIRAQLSGSDEINEVNIKTFEEGAAVAADTSVKWQPTTRETADHSTPYGVALALLYGTVEIEHFSDEYLESPAVAAMLRKIKIETWPELTALYPEERRSVVEVVTHAGRRFVEGKGYHRGHPRDPMSDDEVEHKFRSLAEPRLGTPRADELVGRLWDLEAETNVANLVELTTVVTAHT